MRMTKSISLKIRDFTKISHEGFIKYRYKNTDVINIIYYEISKSERHLSPIKDAREKEIFFNGLIENRDKYYSVRNNYYTKKEITKILKCDHRKVNKFYRLGCIRGERIDTPRGEGLRTRYCRQDVDELKEELDAKKRRKEIRTL